VPPHINVPGLSGSQTLNIEAQGGTNGFYRIRVE